MPDHHSQQPRTQKKAAPRRPQPTSGRARAPREGCERLFRNDRDAPNHAIEGGASAELASRLLGHPRVSGMARRVVRLNGPGDVCGPRRDHDEDLTENGDDGGASLDLGVAAAPRDEHLPRGRFRWRSRGPRSAKSRPSCSSKIRTIVGSVSFLPGIGRVLESEQVLTPLAQMDILLWPGVGDGRCMFGVICETSVSVGRLVGRLGARPSQPAAAARAGWHGPLGDLCWSSPSSGASPGPGEAVGRERTTTASSFIWLDDDMRP